MKCCHGNQTVIQTRAPDNKQWKCSKAHIYKNLTPSLYMLSLPTQLNAFIYFCKQLLLPAMPVYKRLTSHNGPEVLSPQSSWQSVPPSTWCPVDEVTMGHGVWLQLKWPVCRAVAGRTAHTVPHFTRGDNAGHVSSCHVSSLSQVTGYTVLLCLSTCLLSFISLYCITILPNTVQLLEDLVIIELYVRP